METSTYFKTSEFARICGVSIRTLRFYDIEDLLKPSYISDSGHRLYTLHDIIKLQHIVTLKYIGFSLSEIKDIVENQKDLNSLLATQRKIIEDKLEHMHKVVSAIKAAEEAIHDPGCTETNHTIKIINAVHMEKNKEFYLYYLTNEQLEKLRKRNYTQEQVTTFLDTVGDLIHDIKQAVKSGTKPTSENAQLLADKLFEMIKRFVQNDASIEQSLIKLFMGRDRNELPTQNWLLTDSEWTFISTAMKIRCTTSNNVDLSRLLRFVP